MMPVHIVRPIGKHERIPAYSTDELLRGVCHIAYMRVTKEGVAKERVTRCTETIIAGQKLGREVRGMRSREKFEKHKEEIYTALAKGRGVKFVANQYRIGYEALQRYLEEEAK